MRLHRPDTAVPTARRAARLAALITTPLACVGADAISGEQLRQIVGHFELVAVESQPVPATLYESGTGAQRVAYVVPGGSIRFLDGRSAVLARALRIDSGATTRTRSDTQTVRYSHVSRDVTFTVDSGTPNQFFASGFLDGDTLLVMSLFVRTPSPLEAPRRHYYRLRR